MGSSSLFRATSTEALRSPGWITWKTGQESSHLSGQEKKAYALVNTRWKFGNGSATNKSGLHPSLSYLYTVPSKSIGTTRSILCFCKYTYNLGLREDEHETRVQNFSFHFLVFTLICVKLLRTWHLWHQTTQFLGEQKYWNFYWSIGVLERCFSRLLL